MYKILFLFILSFIFVACESYNDKQDPRASIIGDIIDNSLWYLDQSTGVQEANISIPPAPNAILCTPYNNTSAPLRPCTLLDIENDTDAFDDYTPELSILFSASNFIPSSNFDNAILKQKGKSTRSAEQKSYKVKLNSKTDLWDDERRIQFNKQFFDLTRIRNKLSFDLFQDVPNITSLKTEFIHLFLNNEDRGLFTKVETYDKEYLLHRGFDEDDNLYKAQDFWFYLAPELALNISGTPVDLEAFNKVIEIQRGKEQTKLIEMLEAVNDSSRDINSIIAKYFNRKNYVTWLAVNIIFGNVDTITQNYFLLNPRYSSTFYFLPWDYDDSFGWAEQLGSTGYYARWQKSFTRWWDSPLHSRFLSIKANRDELDAMIYELRVNYLNDIKIQAKIDSYKPLVRSYITSYPDKDYMPYLDTNVTRLEEVWESECDILTQRIQENIDAYENQKGSPMPFWQSYSYSNGVLKLQWDESIDLEGDSLVYDIELADNYDFNNSLINEQNLSAVNGDLNSSSYGEISYNYSNAGIHIGDILYMKVTAKEKVDSTHFQSAFDTYVTYDDRFYHGVLKFELR